MNDNITNNKKKVPIKEENFSEKSKEIEKEKIDEEKEKLKKEISSLREKNLLLLANNENQREKYRKEFEQNLIYNKKRIILWVLDILDRLEEVILFIRKDEGVEKIKIESHLEVLEKIKSNYEKKLEGEGVKEIKIVLKEQLIDSYYHEKIAEEENNDLTKGTIIEVMKKGYLLNGQVLRVSQVKISNTKNEKNASN